MKSVRIEEERATDSLNQPVMTERIKKKEQTEEGPKVGIFWLIPANIIDSEEILFYREQTIQDAEHADVFYDSTFEHYRLWNSAQKMFPKLKNVPYEKYPRGRVTFVAKNYPHDGEFKLIADVKILDKEECLQKIKILFNMKNNRTQILRDAHYKT